MRQKKTAVGTVFVHNIDRLIAMLHLEPCRDFGVVSTHLSTYTKCVIIIYNIKKEV